MSKVCVCISLRSVFFYCRLKKNLHWCESLTRVLCSVFLRSDSLVTNNTAPKFCTPANVSLSRKKSLYTNRTEWVNYFNGKTKWCMFIQYRQHFNYNLTIWTIRHCIPSFILFPLCLGPSLWRLQIVFVNGVSLVGFSLRGCVFYVHSRVSP